MKSSILTLVAATACTHDPAPSAMTDARLRSVLEHRYAGDRTATCVAAAVIEAQVSRAIVCAGPDRRAGLTGDQAFEIGSISKTMTGALLASLIGDGRLALADPIARYLPAGTVVPTFGGAPILVKHLVTHTSGLPEMPARAPLSDPANPYADLSDAALLASLADVTLARAPGAGWAYSNFGGMLLSYIVTHVAGTSFEGLAQARLFGPLGMRHAYVAQPPAGVAAVVGHLVTGAATSPWDFPANLAGVGGVRATLDDMVRYAEAQLGRGDPRTAAILATTHEVVALGAPRAPGDPEMAMAWVRGQADGHRVLFHDGGTGGFSSFMAFDRDRAVVVLADTELGDLGGVADLGVHLLDPTQPLLGPRTVATPSPALVQALAGRYRVTDALEVTLVDQAGALVAVLPDGATLTFGYDSRGDFFPHELAGVLTPTRAPDGTQTFVWIQGGVPVSATRLTP